jgi:DNA-binding protein HU-beta
MNKAELVKAVADSAELSQTEAGRAVDAVIDVITNSLKKGDSVAIAGFGTFAAKHRKARDGRNPRTGETVKIPAKTSGAFKAGSRLKDL